jgi:hypothetical protein
MSNIVDKLLYILLQFLLSWAFDASAGILDPLQKYALSETMVQSFLCESPFKSPWHGTGADVFVANYLVEDCVYGK